MAGDCAMFLIAFLGCYDAIKANTFMLFLANCNTITFFTLTFENHFYLLEFILQHSIILVVIALFQVEIVVAAYSRKGDMEGVVFTNKT